MLVYLSIKHTSDKTFRSLSDRLTQVPHCVTLTLRSESSYFFPTILECMLIPMKGGEMIRQLSLSTKQAILITAVALAIIIFPNTGMAFDQINTTSLGVAIKGYDTVAYHTEGRAVKGKRDFSRVWRDAKWLFASAAHRGHRSERQKRVFPQMERRQMVFFQRPQYGAFCCRSGALCTAIRWLLSTKSIDDRQGCRC